MYQLYSLQMDLEGVKYVAVMYSVNSGDIIKYELISWCLFDIVRNI